MRRAWSYALCLAAGLFGLSCTEALSLFGTGLHLKVRVAEAQLQEGPLSDDQGGPSVTQVLRPQPQVMRGEAGVVLKGRVGADAVALHIAAEDDPDLFFYYDLYASEGAYEVHCASDAFQAMLSGIADVAEILEMTKLIPFGPVKTEPVEPPFN